MSACRRRAALEFASGLDGGDPVALALQHDLALELAIEPTMSKAPTAPTVYFIKLAEGLEREAEALQASKKADTETRTSAA